MVETLVLKSYEYLMIDAFKRIELNKHYDVNLKPYTKPFVEKVLKFFEEREEYEKCGIIHTFLDNKFNHEINYKIC